MVDKPQKQIDFEELSNLLKDQVIMRIVTVVDITHLSILELLEYGLTRQNINHALSMGVIEIEKEMLPKAGITSVERILVAGDVYFQQFLSSKVKLTALGLYILDCIRGCQTEQEIIEKARQRFEPGTFLPPAHPSRSD
jgi:hypothetical protein